MSVVRPFRRQFGRIAGLDARRCVGRDLGHEADDCNRAERNYGHSGGTNDLIVCFEILGVRKTRILALDLYPGVAAFSANMQQRVKLPQNTECAWRG